MKKMKYVTIPLTCLLFFTMNVHADSFMDLKKGTQIAFKNVYLSIQGDRTVYVQKSKISEPAQILNIDINPPDGKLLVNAPIGSCHFNIEQNTNIFGGETISVTDFVFTVDHPVLATDGWSDWVQIVGTATFNGGNFTVPAPVEQTDVAIKELMCEFGVDFPNGEKLKDVVKQVSVQQFDELVEKSYANYNIGVSVSSP